MTPLLPARCGPHAEELLDHAYAAVVAAPGELSPWTPEATLDLHGYSVALAGAAMRHVLRSLADEHTWNAPPHAFTRP